MGCQYSFCFLPCQSADGQKSWSSLSYCLQLEFRSGHVDISCGLLMCAVEIAGPGMPLMGATRGHTEAVHALSPFVLPRSVFVH